MSWVRRLRSLMNRRSLDRELDEELSFHLEMRERQYIEQGQEPAEARRAARRQFGNRSRAAEDSHYIWGFAWLDELARNLRFALRSFGKDPGFTFTALVTICLGIGITAAVFAVVKAVLFQPLPYAEPDRLVMLWNINEKAGVKVERQRVTGQSMSPREYIEWRDHSDIFAELAAVHREPRGHLSRADQVLSLDADANGEVTTLAFVTDNFYRTLGVFPVLGRPSEVGNAGVVLQYNYWQNRFGADPGIVGTSVWMGAGYDGAAQWHIVGVMPPGFGFYTRKIDFLTRLNADRAAARSKVPDPNRRWWIVVGRLKPGLTLSEAQARADVFSSRMAADYPDENRDWHVQLVPVMEDLTSGLRPALLTLLGAAGFVLLIVCTNVAGVLLVKATSRGKEFALRSALGASRLGLLRQLLTESLVLALTGGVLGLYFAQGLVHFVRTLTPNRHTWGQFLIQAEFIEVDRWVVGFVLVSALAVGLLFGMISALRASKPDVNEALKDAGSGSMGGRHGGRLRHTLVFVEVALAVVLVAGAGLLIRSFLALYGQGPGFQDERRLALSIMPTAEFVKQHSAPGAGNGDANAPDDDALYWTAKDLFRETAIQNISGLPGVLGVTSASRAPMKTDYNLWEFHCKLDVSAPDSPSTGAILTAVQPNYFHEMGIPLLSGRGFESTDRAGANPVAVVSREFANRCWPGDDPIGKRIKTYREQDPWLTVVGVAGDVHEDGIDKPSQAYVYHPWAQFRWWYGPVNVVIRTSKDPMALLPLISRTVADVDAGTEVRSAYSLDVLVRDSAWRLNYSTLMLGGLAGLSLLLAAVGVYGVLSQTVRERTREVGLRMAMGAGRKEVVQMVLNRALVPVSLGIVVGLAAAAGLTRFLRSLLYGVEPIDPLTFAGVAFILLAAALLASYLPARKAARVNPVVALRYE